MQLQSLNLQRREAEGVSGVPLVSSRFAATAAAAGGSMSL